MTLRGRHWLGIWLAFFLTTMAAVIARQTAAHVAARELRELREDHRVLNAEYSELVRRIQTGRSRAGLIPRAERLGLRMPHDSEVVDLHLNPGSR